MKSIITALTFFIVILNGIIAQADQFTTHRASFEVSKLAEPLKGIGEFSGNQFHMEDHDYIFELDNIEAIGDMPKGSIQNSSIANRLNYQITMFSGINASNKNLMPEHNLMSLQLPDNGYNNNIFSSKAEHYYQSHLKLASRVKF